jgi:regulator of sigma E protease
VGQLLLSLSILVILHEFGHYITARWFGCRVERFFLFFDPWFALFKKKVGETVYGIGWLPLGGYVKISGMIDESMDKEQLALPPQPWEFRSKPAWQRLIVMLGGVIMNVLTAIVIYAFITMVWGEKKVPLQSLKYGIAIQDSLLYQIGLKNGDNVVSVNGKEVADYRDLALRIAISDSLEVERNGQRLKLVIPTDMIGKLVERKRSMLLLPRTPATLGAVVDTLGAGKAGLRTGDRILAVNGQPVGFFDELAPLVQPRKGQVAEVQFLRGKDTLSRQVQISAEGKLSVAPFSYPYVRLQQMDSAGYLQFQVTRHGPLQAIPAGLRLAQKSLTDYIDQFKKIVQPSTGGYKAVGGFKAIGNLFAPVWDWESFWMLTAFLSIMLAFMNLLPIPALDGGHVLFTLIEMITGRKPNQKFLEIAQVIGMVLLLGLMLYANLNDWIGWGKGK